MLRCITSRKSNYTKGIFTTIRLEKHRMKSMLFIRYLRIPIQLLIHVAVAHQWMNKHQKLATNVRRLIVFGYLTKLDSRDDCIDPIEQYCRKFIIKFNRSVMNYYL